MANSPIEQGTTIRVDRWLWFARFFKSRSLASKLVQSKKVRVNSTIIAKASLLIKTGDILTFPQAKEIRVVKVLEIGQRRGPAPEAQLLYEDLTPKETKAEKEASRDKAALPKRERGAGRPTKADRRALDKFRHENDL